MEEELGLKFPSRVDEMRRSEVRWMDYGDGWDRNGWHVQVQAAPAPARMKSTDELTDKYFRPGKLEKPWVRSPQPGDTAAKWVELRLKPRNSGYRKCRWLMLFSHVEAITHVSCLSTRSL